MDCVFCSPSLGSSHGIRSKKEDGRGVLAIRKGSSMVDSNVLKSRLPECLGSRLCRCGSGSCFPCSSHQAACFRLNQEIDVFMVVVDGIYRMMLPGANRE